MSLIWNLIERAREIRAIVAAQLAAPVNPEISSVIIPVRTYSLGEATKPTPLFGAEMGGFGEDWAYRKAPSPAPQGVVREGVAAPIVNRSGSSVNLQAENLGRVYEDPNTSRAFHRTSEETDQQPIHQRTSIAGAWDGVVRNAGGARPSFLTSPRPVGKQSPEPTINKDPYSFY